MKKINPIKEEFCDVCGQSCAVLFKDPVTEQEYIINNEAMLLSTYWGYGSKYDLEYHQCILCETCYDKVAKFINKLGGKIRKYNYNWANLDILDEIKNNPKKKSMKKRRK
jgi:hypothetical protein